MCRKNRNTPDFSDLSATIPDDRGCLQFPVFISWESLGRSGNSGIPDRLGFSQHMKTRLKQSPSGNGQVTDPLTEVAQKTPQTHLIT